MNQSIETQATITCEESCAKDCGKSYAAKTFAALKNWFSARLKRKQSRAILGELFELDDRSLKDIGITRDDVYYASKLTREHTKFLELQRHSRITRDLRSNF